MTDEDPFFGGGGDRTILRPRPGGRRPQAAPPPAQQPSYSPPPPAYAPPPPPQQQPPAYQQPSYAPPPAYAPPPQSYAPRPAESAPAAGAAAPVGGGLNPLTSAAGTLLALLSQLRGSAHHPDPSSLFQHIVGELRQFETVARANGESPDAVLAGRYTLCTALDEAVLNTPWGSQSVWATQTLLVTFHNEAWGGEKVFQLLDRLIQEPGRSLHLLELIYVTIALGFEGKFRIQDRGRAELERIQESLFQTIRMQRGEVEPVLSPHWQGVQDKRSRLIQYVPLWVVAAICAGVLVVVYLGFLFTVNRSAEPVLAQIASLGAAPPVARTAPPPPTADLRQYLGPQIADRSLDVRDGAQGQVVTMAGDGLFSSGRADVRPDRVPLLLTIADALNKVPGRVTVTGHSDNVPTSVLGRYKSNWDLSQARAEAVMQIIATRVPADRLTADGVADTQPIAANDTADGRSRNRRVEITLQPQAGRQ